MRAVVFSEVPNTNAASAVAAYDLALVGVDNYVVDCGAVAVAPLNRATASLPDLDGAVLRAGNHPFAFAVKSNAGDIACMAFECKERVWIGGLDIVELDSVVACSSKETLIGGDTQSINLRVGVLDRT